jgi:hypothetical protein
VRTAEHTRGHVLVVMLAYLIRRNLSQAWTSLDITVEEGLNQLQMLCSTEISLDGGASCLRLPTPSPASLPLLKTLQIHLPKLLPHTRSSPNLPSSLLTNPFPDRKRHNLDR